MSTELVFIAGPTAVGKTYFAEKISDMINGEIISCDSRTIYRGLDIGTGKSSNSSSIRYHMVDLIEPGDILYFNDLVKMTRDLILDIEQRGSVPIICGGSHYWMERVIDGMIEAPPPDLEHRNIYRHIEMEEGKGSLHRILHKKDPDLASKVHPNNISRILRYLEISDKNDLVERIPPLENKFKIFFLDRSIVTLGERIRERASIMIEDGWEDEVKGLMEKGIGIDDPGMDSIGYKRIYRSIEKGSDIQQCLDPICSDTILMARSQRRWKNRLGGTIRIDLDRSTTDEVTMAILDRIR